MTRPAADRSQGCRKACRFESCRECQRNVAQLGQRTRFGSEGPWVRVPPFRPWVFSSAVERLPVQEDVTGSIPVRLAGSSPSQKRGSSQVPRQGRPGHLVWMSVCAGDAGHVAVAQSDRAPDYGSGCRGFESLRPRMVRKVDALQKQGDAAGVSEIMDETQEE